MYAVMTYNTNQNEQDMLHDFFFLFSFCLSPCDDAKSKRKNGVEKA